LRYLIKIICCFIPFIFLQSCFNPFAPSRIDSEPGIILGDQKTIDGFFQCFAYAYNMKDTVIYSNLLADDFVFAYMNYEKGLPFSWSREEDMLATYRLFNKAQNLYFV
jgi:hypothetical protein